MFTTPVTWDTGNTADRAVGMAAGRVGGSPCKAVRYLSAIPLGNLAGRRIDRLGHISACISSVGPHNLEVEEGIGPELDLALGTADSTGHSQADILVC